MPTALVAGPLVLLGLNLVGDVLMGALGLPVPGSVVAAEWVAILAANVVGVLAVLVVVGLVHERLAPAGPPDG